MSRLDAFRQETRAWLEANCPPSMRTPMPVGEMVGGGRRARFGNPESKRWLERMGGKGWTAPMWPAEFGGGGLDKEQNQVLQQELRAIHARPALTGMGLSMIGPALLEFGNEEQKKEHLPKIVSGEIWWCQGYSEPGAGSDLASLQTRAVDTGDHFVVNGSKIWTSGADQADWMFCLVRTDPDAAKHDGISFVLFDMTTPGVTVKPIRLISGQSPFCETFLDNVRVEKRNLVYGLNKGWTVAKRLLQYERTSIGGGMGGLGRSSDEISDAAKRYVGLANGRLRNGPLRDRITHHRLDERAFKITAQRAGEESRTGVAPGAYSSFLKYFGTELNKNRFELLLAAMGAQSMGWDGDGFEADELGITRQWLRSKANSIEGGTSEVQLNIIAKRILGLPD
jgi:alkylation response protein AidB-like acyl-CoA dehydrogenase